MAPERKQFYYGHQDILELVDKRTTKDVMMDFNRKELDPEKLDDVIQYVAQYGRLGVRARLGAAVLGHSDVIAEQRGAVPRQDRPRRQR